MVGRLQGVVLRRGSSCRVCDHAKTRSWSGFLRGDMGILFEAEESHLSRLLLRVNAALEKLAVARVAVVHHLYDARHILVCLTHCVPASLSLHGAQRRILHCGLTAPISVPPRAHPSAPPLRCYHPRSCRFRCRREHSAASLTSSSTTSTRPSQPSSAAKTPSSAHGPLPAPPVRAQLQVYALC